MTALLLATACGSGDKKASSTDAGVTLAAPTKAAAAPTTTAPDKPTPPPSPAPPLGNPVAGGEAVAFATSDGLTLKGNLYSAPGPKRRLVIFAASMPDTEAGFQPFAKELAGGGIATLTFQMPGYKEYNNGDRDVTLMDKDLEAAVLFMESRDYPLIYVVGDTTAGVGALRLGTRHKLAGIVTISSPTTAGAVNALTDIAKVTAPKLFIAGQDSRSPASVTSFMQAALEPKQSKVFDGPGGGASMLTGPDGPALKQLIKDFVSK